MGAKRKKNIVTKLDKDSIFLYFFKILYEVEYFPNSRKCFRTIITCTLNKKYNRLYRQFYIIFNQNISLIDCLIQVRREFQKLI